MTQVGAGWPQAGPGRGAQDAAATILASVFPQAWPVAVAAALRVSGDLQAAEDAAGQAMLSALGRWSAAGVPDNPAGWLVTASRNKALNQVRGRVRAQDRIRSLGTLAVGQQAPDPAEIVAGRDGMVGDDRLRLIFTCCHPVLGTDAQVALTLRAVAGLATPEIARAFLVSEATMAQRIVRAKRTLAERAGAYREPTGPDLAARLPAVLDVIYLIFNEAYLAASGADLTRPLLGADALRLARLVAQLMPEQAEPWGLLALIAFTFSRDAARTDAGGALVTLADQDRSRWDQALIADGRAALSRAESLDGRSRLTVQAHIAGLHATAGSFATTDWVRIVACYDELLGLQDNAVVALNRAVAVAMADGPQAGLQALDDLLDHPALQRSHRIWAVRADLLRRCGDHSGAVAMYRQALDLVDNDIERRYLATCLATCTTTGPAGAAARPASRTRRPGTGTPAPGPT